MIHVLFYVFLIMDEIFGFWAHFSKNVDVQQIAINLLLTNSATYLWVFGFRTFSSSHIEKLYQKFCFVQQDSNNVLIAQKNQ